MSIKQVTRFQLVCDSCGNVHEDEEFGGEIVFDSVARASAEVDNEHSGWSTDGEWLHHCDSCEPLELTEVAKAERARVPGPGDVPIAGLGVAS